MTHGPDKSPTSTRVLFGRADVRGSLLEEPVSDRPRTDRDRIRHLAREIMFGEKNRLVDQTARRPVQCVGTKTTVQPDCPKSRRPLPQRKAVDQRPRGAPNEEKAAYALARPLPHHPKSWHRPQPVPWPRVDPCAYDRN